VDEQDGAGSYIIFPEKSDEETRAW